MILRLSTVLGYLLYCSLPLAQAVGELLAIHREADCVWFVLAVSPPLKWLQVPSNSVKAASQGGQQAK